jgi:hypothetical protein
VCIAYTSREEIARAMQARCRLRTKAKQHATTRRRADNGRSLMGDAAASPEAYVLAGIWRAVRRTLCCGCIASSR